MEEVKLDEIQEKENKEEEKSSPKIQPLQSKKSNDSVKDENILANSIADRKKQSFMRIKSWEDKRIQLVNIHKNMTENIMKKLIKRGNDISDSISGILRFLRERAVQINKLVTAPLIPISTMEGLLDTTDIKRALELTESVVIDQNEKLKNYSDYLQKNVLREGLGNLHNHYADLILKTENNFNIDRKNIQILSTKVGEAYSKYSQRFSDSLKGKKFNKNLIIYEFAYNQGVNDHVNQLKKNGNDTMQFWYDLQIEEEKLLECLKETLEGFLNASKELFIQGFEELRTISVSVSIKEAIQRFYSVSGVLAPEESNYVKKWLKEANSIGIDEVKKYFQEFDLPGLEASQMILEKSKGKFNTEECDIVVTFDKILLIIPINDANAAVFTRADISQTTVDGNILTIDSKQTGRIFDSKQKFVLEMESTEEAINFGDFLNNFS